MFEDGECEEEYAKKLGIILLAFDKYQRKDDLDELVEIIVQDYVSGNITEEQLFLVYKYSSGKDAREELLKALADFDARITNKDLINMIGFRIFNREDRHLSWFAAYCMSICNLEAAVGIWRAFHISHMENPSDHTDFVIRAFEKGFLI